MAAPCRPAGACSRLCWRTPVNSHKLHRCPPAHLARTRCAAASPQQPNQDLPPAAAQLVDPAALAASATAAIGAQSDVAVDEAVNLPPTSNTAGAAAAAADSPSSQWVPEPSGLPTEVIYSSLAAVFAAAGAAVSVLAPSLAAASAGSSPPTAAVAAPVLLGCFGAHLVRLSSLCWFLKVRTSRRSHEPQHTTSMLFGAGARLHWSPGIPHAHGSAVYCRATGRYVCGSRLQQVHGIRLLRGYADTQCSQEASCARGAVLPARTGAQHVSACAWCAYLL